MRVVERNIVWQRAPNCVNAAGCTDEPFCENAFWRHFCYGLTRSFPSFPLPPLCTVFFFARTGGADELNRVRHPGPESSRCWAIRFSARFSLNFHTHLIFADRWIWFPWEISKSSASLSFHKLHTSIIIKENIYGYMFFLLSIFLYLSSL